MRFKGEFASNEIFASCEDIQVRLTPEQETQLEELATNEPKYIASRVLLEEAS